jgi:hypothetical protein
MPRQLLPLLFLFFCLPTQSANQEDPIPEYAMKAAFVYNFMLFTDWPALPNNTLQICTMESDQLKRELEQYTKNQPHGAKLIITKISNLAKIQECQILFLSEEDLKHIPTILPSVEGSPVLTVTDVQGLVGKGAIIGMSIKNRHIIFEVDSITAKKSRLHLSSKLLNLAKTVY